MFIRLKDIYVKKFDNCILKDISFEINEGEYVNIIGPNGSGKTTLIRLLTGLLEPTGGEIEFGHLRLGYVPQHLNHVKFMPSTVYEVLKNSNKDKVSEDEMDFLLELMEIKPLKHKKMRLLSGGESQRVYIVRALLSKPDVLLLDEPTSALDPVFRKKFYKLIEDYHQNGMTIIHVTHDLSDGLRHGSKIIQLDQIIHFIGSFDEFQDHHSDHHGEDEGVHYHV